MPKLCIDFYDPLRRAERLRRAQLLKDNVAKLKIGDSYETVIQTCGQPYKKSKWVFKPTVMKYCVLNYEVIIQLNRNGIIKIEENTLK